jgi:hypothetical protein
VIKLLILLKNDNVHTMKLNILPENIAKKFAESIVNVASGWFGDSPLPVEPLPFLRSKYQVPDSSPNVKYYFYGSF